MRQKIVAAAGSDVDLRNQHASKCSCKSQENENGIAAEIAKTMGIIPDETDEQDVPYFYPDEYATREFASYTAVMLMGYETTDEEPTCADAAQIRYKKVQELQIRKIWR